MYRFSQIIYSLGMFTLAVTKNKVVAALSCKFLKNLPNHFSNQCNLNCISSNHGCLNLFFTVHHTLHSCCKLSFNRDGKRSRITFNLTFKIFNLNFVCIKSSNFLKIKNENQTNQPFKPKRLW